MIIVTKKKSNELYNKFNLNHYFNSKKAILLYDTKNNSHKEYISGKRLEPNIIELLVTLPLSKRYN